MRRGFTLIELLAVIVILAIIALIATPLVLSIIKDSKKNAQLRSAEMYLDVVEQTVLKEKLKDTTFKPNICNIKDKKLYCNEREEKLKVEVNGEKPDNGYISFSNGKITDIELTYSNGKTIVKDTKGDLVYQKTFREICKYVNNGVEEKTAGAKYTCEVKPGTSYTFHVLTTPSKDSKTINLIMDRNVCSDGTPTDADRQDKCLVAWQSSDANKDGPVIAMDYLYNATKNWESIPNIVMNYTDEGSTADSGYGTIITTNNITKITNKDNTEVTVLTDKEGYINLKARMPYRTEVSQYDSENKTNLYLYNYLNSYNDIQTNVIVGINGYWTLSSRLTRGCWIVLHRGILDSDYVSNVGNYGVRPVITLKLK